MADTQTNTSCKNALLFPEIVKKVFHFFCARELRDISSVCHLWKSQADIVLGKRQQFSWQLFEEDLDRGGVEDDCGSTWIQIQDYFHNLSFIPKTAVVFIAADSWKKKDKVFSQNGTKKARLDDLPCNLPKGCAVVYSITTGITGTSSDLSSTLEQEHGSGAAILCFGNYPGIDVSLWELRNSVDAVHETVSHFGIEDLKLALMLTNTFKTEKKSLDLFRTQSPLIVGGINKMSFCKCNNVQHVENWAGNVQEGCSRNEVLQRVGVRKSVYVFFRGIDIKVACEQLGQEIDSENAVENSILRLKEKTKSFPMNNTVAFMFACVARGEYLYDKDHIECSAFRKHFPSTPLLGFFGNGEIGCEHPIAPEMCKEIIHGYTTFIVFVNLP